MKNTVAVLIPAYRPGEKLRELLRRLARQRHVPEEVLILLTADSAAGDEGAALSDAFGNCFPGFSVCRIEKNQFGHGRTRDLGFQMTKSELVLCMTQDAVPRDRYLISRLERAFLDPLIGAAYARQIAGKKSSPLEKEARKFNYPEVSCVKSADDLQRLGIKTFFCSDVCAMWRRTFYQRLGGFEKDVIFNEDMILAGKMIRAGYRIAYCADAQVYHAHHYTALKQFHRNFDLGVSQADHPEIFRMASSGKEGIRFVKTASRDLVKSGYAGLVPQFLWQSGCRYVGYQLGTHYRLLPVCLIMKLSDSPSYWENRLQMVSGRRRTSSE